MLFRCVVAVASLGPQGACCFAFLLCYDLNLNVCGSEFAVHVREDNIKVRRYLFKVL